MTKITKEVSRRKMVYSGTEKRIRDTLTFAISEANLDDFKIIEKTQEIYGNIQRTYEEYASDLVSEDKEVTSDFDDYIHTLLKEVKNISDNVLVEFQNTLIYAYNECTFIFNGEKDEVNYGKVLSNVEESQELLNKSSETISDVVTAMGVFKEAFESEVGMVIVTKITQICEELLGLISGGKGNDVVLSLVALQAISEKKG